MHYWSDVKPQQLRQALAHFPMSKCGAELLPLQSSGLIFFKMVKVRLWWLTSLLLFLSSSIMDVHQRYEHCLVLIRWCNGIRSKNMHEIVAADPFHRRWFLDMVTSLGHPDPWIWQLRISSYGGVSNMKSSKYVLPSPLSLAVCYKK